MMKKKAFDATKMRLIREALGLSQAQLAEKLGVSPSAVFFWEDGRSEPRVEQHIWSVLRAELVTKRQQVERLANELVGVK